MRKRNIKSFTHLPALIMIPTAYYARWGVVTPGESRVGRWLEKMLSFGEKALLCAIWGGVYISSWRCHIAYLLPSDRPPRAKEFPKTLQVRPILDSFPHPGNPVTLISGDGEM